MPAISSQQRAAIITALQNLRRVLASDPQESFPEGVYTIANDPKFADDPRRQRAVGFRLAAKALQDALHLIGPIQYAPLEVQPAWRILNHHLGSLGQLPAPAMTLRELKQLIEDLGDRNQGEGDWTEKTPANGIATKDGGRSVQADATGVTIHGIRGNVDFGVITVRQDEFAAVLQRFSPRSPVTGGRRLYEHCSLRTVDGRECGVAMVRCLEQGPGMAQAVTRDLIDDLDPRWLLLVGIAGGLPCDEYSLGDVILASRLHDFCVSAAIENAPAEFTVAGGPLHLDVEAILSHLPAREERLAGWNRPDSIGQARPTLTVPGVPSKALYGDRTWRKRVQSSLRRNFDPSVPRDPKYWIGPMASSGTLVKDTGLAQQWLAASRAIANVEMELGGVYQGARYGKREDPHVLAVRALSDIVGYKRSPEWTEYACHSAAAFAFALVRSGIVNLVESRR